MVAWSKRKLSFVAARHTIQTLHTIPSPPTKSSLKTAEAEAMHVASSFRKAS